MQAREEQVISQAKQKLFLLGHRVPIKAVAGGQRPNSIPNPIEMP